MRTRLVIFARWPEPGRVKTRLAAHIGGESACQLYRLFVETILQGTANLPLERTIHFTPAHQQKKMEKWLGRDTAFVPQTEGSLGERMKCAFEEHFRGGEDKVLVIGSDSPDMPESYFYEALEVLDKTDSVIGPAQDGGYYLLGFRKIGFLAEAFFGPTWSSSTVFSETEKILKEKGRTIHVLPFWEDVDTEEDAKRLFGRLRGQRNPLTRFLAELFHLDFAINQE